MAQTGQQKKPSNPISPSKSNKKGFIGSLGWPQVVLFLAIATGLFFLARWGYRELIKDNPRKASLDNSGGFGPKPQIPQGWSPDPVVERLWQAMFGGWTGLGTHEDVILNELSELNDAQLVEVYNAYGDRYDRDLLKDFASEMEDSNLKQATNYFSGLV
jgi:hypothetical protein